MHPFFRSDIPILDIALSKCWNINLCWRSKRSSLILSLTCILELDCNTQQQEHTIGSSISLWEYFQLEMSAVQDFLLY